MKKVNLIGQKFGKLLVINEQGVNKWGNCLFLCKCDCGGKKIIPSANLLDKRTSSCGCMSSRTKIGLLNLSHGLAHSSFYNRYMTIKARCNNPKSHKWPIYGGRGIKCLWKSFEKFRNDMYSSFINHVEKFGNKNTIIDRIDVNGNYTKKNCRWVTAKESSLNIRKNL